MQLIICVTVLCRPTSLTLLLHSMIKHQTGIYYYKLSGSVTGHTQCRSMFLCSSLTTVYTKTIYILLHTHCHTVLYIMQVYAAARASADYDPATMLAAFEAGGAAATGSSEQPWNQGGALLQPQQSRYAYHCCINTSIVTAWWSLSKLL
jgi:hypothetical protein